MHRKAFAVLGAAVASLALAGPALAAPISSTTAETFMVNTYDATNDGTVGPVASSGTMMNNKYYVIQATGTWSNWNASLWDFGKACGTPAASPLFPTPGLSTYKVGIDPEFTFAFAKTRRYDCNAPEVQTPKQQGKFQISLAGTSSSAYRHYRAAGNPTTPSASHGYTYYVESSSNGAFNVRYLDPISSDNYGQAQVSIRRATSTDCANGNWASFRTNADNQAFTSQTSCSNGV
jgi:hypothetical protein